MSRFLPLFIALFTLGALPATVHAQVAGKIFVLCEGGSGGSLDVIDYSGDVSSATYRNLDSVPGFSSSIFLHDTLLFVARADNQVDVWNANTETKVDSFTPGTQSPRQFAVYNNQLLVTSHSAPYLAAYDLTNSYTETFNLDTNQLNARTEAVLVEGNTAYVSVIGILDTNFVNQGPNYVLELDLSTNTPTANLQTDVNPERFFLNSATSELIVGNTRTFVDGGSLQRFDVSTTDTLPQATDSLNFYPSSFTADDTYLYMVLSDLGFSERNIGRYNFSTQTVDTAFVDTDSLNLYYSLLYLEDYDVLVAGRTDYVNFGSIQFISDLDGTPTLSDTLMGNISPRSLAFWAPEQTSSRLEPKLQVSVYPNPATTHLSLRADQAAMVELLDLQGRSLRRVELLPGQETRLEVADLPAGLYLLRDLESGSMARKVLIQN